MITFNGWQRLWVLISVVLIAPAGILTFNTWPKPEHIPHQEVMDSLNGEARAVFALNESLPTKNSDTTVKFPDGHMMTVRDATPREQMLPAMRQYKNQLESKLRTKRTRFSFEIVVGWGLICILLYILGWLVAWVRKGFRQATV